MASPPPLLLWLTTFLLLGGRGAKVASGIDLSLGFLRQPSDVIAERNQPLTVNCSAFSGTEYGPVAVTWRYKGVELNESRRRVLPNGSLYFPQVVHQKKTGKSDIGEYQCVASNSVGTLVSRPIHLAIANVSRKFSEEPRTQTVEEGDVVRFSCQIAAVPPSVLTWQKNNENLPQSDNWVTGQNSGVLLISGVLKTDTGKYRCLTAANVSSSKPRRSADAFLEVKPAANKYRPPTILTPPHVVTVTEDEEAVLECAASGYPRPEVTWVEKDKIDPKRVTKTGQGNLVFTKVLPSDTGVYTCNATNVDAETGRTKSATQTISLQVLVPPDFLKRPHSLIVPTVQTVRFECEVTGYPTPSVYWLKDGQVVRHNGRIKLKNHANYELVILQTVTNDSGIYQCVAENEAGYATADARLQVNTSRDQPDPPAGLRAETLTSTSIQLYWNTSTSRNGLAIQAYTVHYAPTNGGDELQKVAVTPSQLIEKLRPFTNYTFYVRAYNGKSASDQSDSLVWATGEDIPLAAPSVSLSSSSPTTLHVSWDQLANDVARGVIVMYKIQWRRRNTPSHYIQEVTGDIREYTVTGLVPGGKYEVRVMGTTRVSYPNLPDNEWPWVRHEMPGQVAAKVPASPILDLTVINSTAIKVKWKIPESNEYEIGGFKLTYRKQKHKLQGPIVIDDNTTSTYMLTDLVSQTWYEVHVMAFNGNGDGGESVRVIQTLHEHPPSDGVITESTKVNFILVEPPSHLEAEPTSATSINVAWKGPDNTIKNISYFTVRYNPVHVVNASTVNYIRSTSKAVIVTDLTPYTMYEFSVRSHDQDNEQGPYSSKVECKTKEDVPTEPLELNWMPVDAHSVRLMWKPPQYPNGVIQSYHVMYNTEKEPHIHPERWTIKEENGSEHSTKINGLASNTLYYFCLRAKTNAGTGPPTEIITLNIPVPFKNQSNTQSVYNDEFQDPQLGIIVGVSIGVGCMIICAFIIVFRNRCFPSGMESPHHYIHHYHHHGNGHLPHATCNGHSRADHRLSSSDSHEMESFMPMLTNVPEPIITNHLDTKGGGYPNCCKNGKLKNGKKKRGFFFSHLRRPCRHLLNVRGGGNNPRRSDGGGGGGGGDDEQDKRNINITENPQHTTWYTSSDHRYLKTGDNRHHNHHHLHHHHHHNGGGGAPTPPPPPPLPPPSPESRDRRGGDDDDDERRSQNEDSGVQLACSQRDDDSCNSSEVSPPPPPLNGGGSWADDVDVVSTAAAQPPPPPSPPPHAGALHNHRHNHHQPPS